MIISGISIDSLLRAQEKFELFRQDMIESSLRQDYGGQPSSLCWPASHSFSDGWFEFMKECNHTVHCYDQEVVDDVVNVFPLFSVELRKFLVNLARSE